MFSLARTALLFLAAIGLAQAQSWPTKPVRLIVSSPIGSAPDIVARIVADKLAPMWGRPLVIDNRGGPTGVVGAAALASADPDGYTFGVLQTAAVALTPVMYKNPQYNVADLKAVAMTGTAPLIIVVHPSVPANNIDEFLKLAKSQPGKLNFALSLANSVPHLVGEMMARSAGAQLYNVPYNGAAQATTATIAGDAQMTINALAPIIPHVKSGKLKALGVTSPGRLPGYPDLPAVNETIPNFSAYGWFAVFSPAKVPDAISERVNADVNQVTALPDVTARLAELGIYPKPMSRAQIAEFVKSEQALWGKVVRDMGIKPE